MQKSNVKKNTIFNAVKTVFGIIYPLITFPYISRVLMAENVGKVNFGNSIVSYFSLIASLGVSTYAIRECSKVRDNQEELNRTTSQIFSINIISTVISYFALVITLIVARPLENYRELICIQSATILFTTLGADWINSAMEDFKFIAIRTMGMQLVSLALMFLFVRRPEDYIKYAVISVVASSGANIINIFYRRKFCKMRFTLQIDWKQHMPPLMNLFLIIAIQTIFVSSDITILGLLRGDIEVGIYSASVKIFNIINTLIGCVNAVVIPQMSSSFYENDYEKINKLYTYSAHTIMIMALPMIIGVILTSKEIIYITAGDEYLDGSVALQILAIATFFSQLGGLLSNLILIPSGNESKCLISTICASLVNIVLNFILIPAWSYNAAAFTTLLSQIISWVMVVPYADKNVKLFSFLKKAKAPLVGSALIIIVNYIVRLMVKNYYMTFALIVVISIVMYFYVLCIFKDEVFADYLNLVRRKKK